MTSKMEPEVTRTSLHSACGSSCQCIPRNVPRRWLNETLHCTNRAFRPREWNSSTQNVRAKKPRSSSLRSSSITNAPFNLVSVKTISPLSPRLLFNCCCPDPCFLSRQNVPRPDASSKHSRLWNRHNEFSAPVPDTPHLFHDFVF